MKPLSEAKDLYREEFGSEKTIGYFSHGRLELLGNHTDHNGGLCLVSAASIGITAAVAENRDGRVRVASKGFKHFSFYLDEAKARASEVGSSVALTRGVISTLKECGYKVGGFSAALVSDILPGAGVSSSAAYSLLVAQIENDLYNGGKIDALTLARVARVAENEYFGKPSGMLDQIGCGYGGVNFLDFSTPIPSIEPISWGLGLDIVLINTGSSHENLTPYYASIRNDMQTVAKTLFGAERLCEATRHDFMARIGSYAPSLSEVAKLRAQHFYDENERVLNARKAILEHDEFTFLEQVKSSELSMEAYLHNTMVPGKYDHSPQQCVDLARKFIGKGACRAMGGGFGGSVICFLFKQDTASFIKAMASYYGKENVIKLSIPQEGPKQIEE